MNAFSIIGATITVLAFVSVASFAVAFAISSLQRVFQRSLDRAVERELRRHGVQMASLVSWFSPKHVDQAATWKAIAEELADGRWPDVAIVRNAGIPQCRAQLQALWALPQKEAAR
jgi:hypothetical protein